MRPSGLVNIIRRDKLNFLFLTGVFIFSLLIIISGGRIVYEVRSNDLKSKVISDLNEDKKAVREFFANCSRDLMFIKKIPGLSEYLPGVPQTAAAKSLAKDILTDFIKNHPYYLTISLVSPDGKERLTVNNTADNLHVIVPASPDRETEKILYPKEAAFANSDRVYASFDVLRGPGGPSVNISSPLFGPDSGLKGFCMLKISGSSLMSQLSKSTFIQGKNEVLIALDNNGGTQQKDGYRLSAADGFAKLSDTENIYCSAVEFLPGYKISIIKYFSYSAFKESLLKLEGISVAIFAAFFVFVLIFSFFNIRNFGRLILAQKAIIYSLANLSEWRDPATGSHVERTRNFGVLLARTLKRKKKTIKEAFISDFYDSVPLHDIGKVGIPDEILLKTDRLSTDEFEVMKSHVIIGKDVIQDIIDRFDMKNSFLVMSRNICHYHHEKYDGTGYPEGLKGEAIPLEARIFAVCDVYDALRSERPYKKGLSHAEALEIITGDRGRHFDPDVIDAMMECNEEFDEIFESYRLFDDTYGKLMNLRSSDALKVSWTDDLSVGNDKIDSQHKEFFDKINFLFAATLKGKAKNETLEAIDFLHNYAVQHFRAEEEMMKRTDYAGRHSHTEAHEIFFKNLISIKRTSRIMDSRLKQFYRYSQKSSTGLSTTS